MGKRTLGPHPYLFPMPTVLIGSIIDNHINYMPAAYVGILNFKPPILGCGLSPKHFTCKGIEKNKEFSVNIPSDSQLEVTDYCGLITGENKDKADLFQNYYGKLKNAPLIDECPVNIECRLIKSFFLGADTLYLGEIIEIHCDDSVLINDQPDITKIKPFMFNSPDKGYYKLGSRIGTAWESGKNYKKK